MFATIINDCRDQNAFGRQATRLAAFLECSVATVGVEDDLEAAGTLVDILDAAGKLPGAVLVNVAPRNGSGKKWPNGTPFGYFYYGETLVVSSVSGHTLSLVKKLDIAPKLHILDISTVSKEMLNQGALSPERARQLDITQFRSFEFLPYVAKWILKEGRSLPSEEHEIDAPVDDALVWYIDVFGNVKTILLVEEVSFEPGGKLKTAFGELPCYARLKDVPDGEAAMIIGSSGIKEKRFLEIVVQGKSAAEKFGIHNGVRVLE